VLSLANWYDQGHWFEYRGHRIWYRDSATAGDWLVLVHGFPTASWDWHRIWQPLSEHFRLLTFDMIGFGWSDKPHPYDYSLFDQADLSEAITRHLGIEQAHLLAHDYGDTVAQELLARLIDGETTLDWLDCCLLNGGIIPGSHRPNRTQRLLASPLGPLVGKLLNRGSFDRAFAGIFGAHTRPNEEELAACWQLVTHNHGKRIAHRLIRYMAQRDRHRDRWVGALQNCPVPLRHINGLDDPISGAHVAAVFRDLVADPDVIELPGIGHYPQLEAPHAVASATLEFFRARTG
jgi:pimeloyl-ACP methyl ester carboxylesterase